MTIDEIISQRRRTDARQFFITPVTTHSHNGYHVIRRKQWYGLQHGDDSILPTIYDNIELLPSRLAIVTIEQCSAVIDITTTQRILPFSYSHIEHTDRYLKLFIQDSHNYGLYDCLQRRSITQPGIYSDYNLCDNTTEYLWAQRESAQVNTSECLVTRRENAQDNTSECLWTQRHYHYDFIHRSTAEIISLPNAILPYDTQRHMIALTDQSTVTVFRPDGTADTTALRQLAISTHGYITLNNYSLHLQHTIDIYGNILS